MRWRGRSPPPAATDEAWPHMEKALAEGTIDARLFTHAGVLAAKLGRTTEAESWLTKARSSPAHVAPLGTSATRRDTRTPWRRRATLDLRSRSDQTISAREDQFAKASPANKNKDRKEQ